MDSRVSSVSSQFSDGAQPSPSSHSSTPSWCEEPAQANMDISTGHMILVSTRRLHVTVLCRRDVNTVSLRHPRPTWRTT